MSEQLSLREYGFVCIGLITSCVLLLLLIKMLTRGHHRLSLGTGRPIILRDENTVRHCRLLLSHPLTSPTDIRLVSLVELIAHKSKDIVSGMICFMLTHSPAQIYEILVPLSGQFSTNTLAIVRRAYEALDKWWSSCDEIYGKGIFFSFPFDTLILRC